MQFDYNGDRVRRIAISPAHGEFSASQSSEGDGATSDPAQGSQSSAGRFVGTWQGLTVPGQIVIRTNGSYAVSGHEGGRYRIAGNDIYFDGELLRA